MGDNRDDGRAQATRDEQEEDFLGDNHADNEEEEVGEDLFGDDMADDYRDGQENDEYDPDLIDDAEHEPMSMEARRAADRAMRNRDRSAKSPARRRLDDSPAAPGASPGASSDGGRAPKRQRRGSPGGPGDDGPGDDGPFDDDFDDEDMPESFYDLAHEELPETGEIERRLDQKIRRCFQQFLLKFAPEGQTEAKYPDLMQRMAEEHQMHLDVSFANLQAWSPKLSLWITEHPVRILPILNESLMSEAARKWETYRAITVTDENKLRVAIHSFPVREPLRDLHTKHLDKLVSVLGVATKRTNVFNQTQRLWLRCSKCGEPNGPFEVVEERDVKPGSCINCQSKGPWRVDRQRTLYRNYQKVTLQESPSSVEPGKMPRSKDVILTGDQVDKVRPGDELQLTGVYRCLYDAATNARTNFPVYRTEIEAVHIFRKGDMKAFEITDEQQQRILELAKQPNIRERIIASMAPSIYGMRHVKIAMALSMMGGLRKETAGKHRIRGDINTLIVGDPGLAKSQFLKYVEGTASRAVYTTGKGASAVGLTAAVTRDESGNWNLEGGAMVLADDGICLIDEFDKMNDQDRTSIHEAMEQQTISISKAGIVAQLQARCAVVAVANPQEGRYDPQRSFAQNVTLSDPILSRFDILCVLRDESDAVQDERLADHVVCSHVRSHPDSTGDDKAVQPKAQLHKATAGVEPIEQDLLQKYFVYARQRVVPKATDIDKDKLANFYKDIRAEAFRSGGAPMTARHVDSIVRIAEANARLELRQHVEAKDLDNAIATMLESFIQSQKHQVSEELRKKFRKYIGKAVPSNQQFCELLDKLFKQRAEQMRLARGAMPESSEVSVEMDDVVKQIEREDLDMYEAHTFMASEQFGANFRKEGSKLFRIV